LLQEILFYVVDGFQTFRLLTVALDNIKIMKTTSINVRRAMLSSPNFQDTQIHLKFVIKQKVTLQSSHKT